MHKKKKQRRGGKKALLILLILIAVAAVGVGVYFLVRNLTGEAVNVYPAADLYTNYSWASESQTSGQVTTDKIQSVYVSSTQQITEIYVEEGQTVHVGDPILAFDTTLSELELQRQSIKVDQLKLDIADAEDELEEIGTYRVGSAPSLSYPTYTGGSGSALVSVPVPYNRTEDGLGTASGPLIYLWDDGCVLDEGFIGQVVALAMENRQAAREAAGPTDPVEPVEPVDPTEPEETGQTEEPAPPEASGQTDSPGQTEAPDETDAPDAPEQTAQPDATPVPEETPVPEQPGELDDPHVYAVFEVRDSNALGGDILRCWELVILLEEDGTWTMQLIEPVYDAGDGSDGYEPDYSDYLFDDTIYYSASEIARMKADCSQRIRELTLELKMAELEYDRLSYELSNGEVYSKIDGVVKTLRDPEEALAENLPVVLVSGGGGYYVTAALSEMELDSVGVGDAVTVMSWENYAEVEGVITEISSYPDESNRYWHYSQGNQNVSLYPFKVFVDEDANLREGEYVDITYSPGEDSGTGLYLSTAFIRQENGRSYIFAAGADGLLEKRYVKTGRYLWGSDLEILDGLTEEDYIAFPYGRQTKDGAKIRYAETDELYSYY